MEKKTLLEIILGTIGGLVFAMGMCMWLLPEWNLGGAGIIATAVGIIILLSIIPIWRKGRPVREHKPIDWGVAGAWIVGALVMGLGMSMVMGEGQENMLLGMGLGTVGLVMCVLDYPIYAYLKGKK